jgi:hypothetical protein
MGEIMEGQIPAGYYPDPEDPTQPRYWDGQSWGAREPIGEPEVPTRDKVQPVDFEPIRKIARIALWTAIAAVILGPLLGFGAGYYYSSTIQGTQGPQGPAGPAGSQGLPGPAGANGLDGAPGLNGLDGAQGAQGAQGNSGNSGPSLSGGYILTESDFPSVCPSGTFKPLLTYEVPTVNGNGRLTSTTFTLCKIE